MQRGALAVRSSSRAGTLCFRPGGSSCKIRGVCFVARKSAQTRLILPHTYFELSTVCAVQVFPDLPLGPGQGQHEPLWESAVGVGAAVATRGANAQLSSLADRPGWTGPCALGENLVGESGKKIAVACLCFDIENIEIILEK